MFKFRFAAALFLLFISAAFPSFSADVDDHLQSAFDFAKKRDWNEAIAHAEAAKSDVLVKYFIWEYLKDPDSNASFKDISGFMDKNPDWPDQSILIKRAEAALLSEMPSDDVLNKWYTEHPPKTNMGRKRNVKDKDELKELIRESWVQDEYTRSSEAKMLSNYSDILRASDHARRIDRLLWDNRIEDAKRILGYAPSGMKQLFTARIALMRSSSTATRDLSNVPAAQHNEPGLLYERMRWRARKSDKEGVVELLLQAPEKVPYPEKWWGYRERAVREALGTNNIKLAERLLAKHGQIEGTVQYKEAQWLLGWVELEFRNKPKLAYDIFEVLFDTMETPGSKARAAYWAGRAAEKAKQDADRWYKEAAKHSTTFYGQLALIELETNPKLTINSDDTSASSSQKKTFFASELVKLVQVLSRAKQSNLAGKFIYYLVENASSPHESVLASELGKDINRIDIGVRASKKALRGGVVALESGYPVIKVAETAGLDKSYLLALMRQESEFYADAVSTSNAMGLMQLLPSTAREVAKKIGVGFAKGRLFDPNYNIKLGSNYLAQMVARFDGSYVLATASYNAGPGRVRQWINAFGAPGNTMRDVVNWIEVIPINETRNYVQHVMGNMQVYRYVLAGKKPVTLTLGHDLMRQ